MGQSQSTRKSEPGAVYRAKAAEHAQARAEALRKSQRGGHQPSQPSHIWTPKTNEPSALSSSNYHNAEAHSLEARMHQQKMIEFNALASREIFRHHNPKHPSNSSTSSFFGAMFSLFVTVPNDLSRLDLHGQYVSEAIPMVEDHLKRCRRQGVKKTLIITGRGAHSPGGVARIKPEVEALLVGMGVKYRRSGKGAFVVECGREGGGIVAWLWRGIFGWGGQ